MTNYMVTVEDTQYRVELAKKGNQQHFSVKIGDKVRDVELVGGKFAYEMPLRVKIDEKTYTIVISKPSKQSSFTIRVEDIPIKSEVKTQPLYTVAQPTRTPIPALTGIKEPVSKGIVDGAVTAPMAGKIIAVRVKKGDNVKADSVLCILEAMKMENEILAPRAGAVQEVNVSEGVIVSEGQVLIVIK
ncbi:MAG: biotin/lipoyl-containing protein [Candidatus Bathyarchaeales archaeon]